MLQSSPYCAFKNKELQSAGHVGAHLWAQHLPGCEDQSSRPFWALFQEKKKNYPSPPKSIHIHRTKGAYFTFKLRMIVEAAPHLKGPFPRPRKAARGSPQSRLSARRNSPGPALSSAIFNETSSQLTLSADGCGQGFPVISGVKDDLSDLCVCVKSFGDH